MPASFSLTFSTYFFALFLTFPSHFVFKCGTPQLHRARCRTPKHGRGVHPWVGTAKPADVHGSVGTARAAGRAAGERRSRVTEPCAGRPNTAGRGARQLDGDVVSLAALCSPHTWPDTTHGLTRGPTRLTARGRECCRELNGQRPSARLPAATPPPAPWHS